MANIKTSVIADIELDAVQIAELINQLDILSLVTIWKSLVETMKVEELEKLFDLVGPEQTKKFVELHRDAIRKFESAETNVKKTFEKSIP